MHMKTQILIFLILLIGLIQCQNQTNQNSHNQSSDAKKSENTQLTPELLVSGTWQEEGDDGYSIQFDKQGKVKGMNRVPQMADPIEGIYSIQGGQLSIKRNIKNSLKDFLTDLYLIEDSNSLKYRFCLASKINSKKLCNINALVPEGQQKFWESIPIVTMGLKPGVTTSDVKIRKKPDIQGETLDFHYVDSSPQNYPYGDVASKPYMPKGYSINVLARTKDKVKVQQWENYWYYVEYYENSIQSRNLKKGWMFGEFVDFIKK